MKRNCFMRLFLISLIFLFVVGCAHRITPLSRYTNIDVDLSKQNYRVVQTNIIGSSHGFSLLGFIPIVPASFNRAMRDIYSNANISDEKKTVLVGTVEKSSTYLIIFSIPRYTIRANAVELLGEKGEK